MLHRIATWLYVITLGGGGALSILGLAVTAKLAGSEPSLFTLKRGVPSVALLLLTIWYSQIYRRKGFTFVALPSYLVSYMLLGIVLDYWLTGWLKNFAPGSPSGAQLARCYAVIWCIVLLLVATAGAVLTSKDASRRRARAG